MSRESFLKRWSRHKQAAAEAAPAEPDLIEPEPIDPEPVDADLPPQLPAVETLDFDSDFQAFMHPKVDLETRNAALKKLFASPHYQASDGLDVYIGDYSAPEALPAAMLAGLEHARALLAADKPEPVHAAGRETTQDKVAALPDKTPDGDREVPAVAPQAPEEPA